MNRSDVLVFTSNVLSKPFTIIGEVNIELTVSSSTKDTDFVVFLMDVDEQNRSIRLGSMAASLVRMRYRNGFDKESLLKKDKRLQAVSQPPQVERKQKEPDKPPKKPKKNSKDSRI